MPPSIDPSKIVVFTGSGISAESGIATFRGTDGTWSRIDPLKVASTEAWETDPQAVLDFHNTRLQTIEAAQPNAAHLALTQLEKRFEVVIITQNIDNLHERAGSSQIVHLHGTALEVCATSPSETQEAIYRGYEPIRLGDTDDQARQLRPRVVWFGEAILHYEDAKKHIETAGRILTVGTSLTVFPAAALLRFARNRAEKILIAHDVEALPFGFQFFKGNATEWVPRIVKQWIDTGPARIREIAP